VLRLVRTLLIFVLLLITARAVQITQGNREIREAFAVRVRYLNNDYTGGYALGIPLDQMDRAWLSVYYRFFPDHWDLEWESLTEMPTLRLASSITYFTKSGSSFQKAFTIPAGTEVLLGSGDCGYGFTGLPDYCPGWHYVVPFVPTGGVYGDAWSYELKAAIKQAPGYYVRDRELLENARAQYTQYGGDPKLLSRMNLTALSFIHFLYEKETDPVQAVPTPGAKQFFRSRGAWGDYSEPPPTYYSDANTFALVKVYYADRLLEARSYYLSPNFLLPVFDGWNIALLAAAGTLAAAYVLLRLQKKKPR